MEELDGDQPIALHSRAMDNLSYIRDAMERSEPFTGISGKGMIAMGLLALAGGQVARQHRTDDWWIHTWLAVAVLGCAIGLATMYGKMRGQDRPAMVRTARRFVMNVAPAVVAGICLTEVFYELRLTAFMPGLWLLLYGTGVVAGGRALGAGAAGDGRLADVHRGICAVLDPLGLEARGHAGPRWRDRAGPGFRRRAYRCRRHCLPAVWRLVRVLTVWAERWLSTMRSEQPLAATREDEPRINANGLAVRGQVRVLNA